MVRLWSWRCCGALAALAAALAQDLQPTIRLRGNILPASSKSFISLVTLTEDQSNATRIPLTADGTFAVDVPRLNALLQVSRIVCCVASHTMRFTHSQQFFIA